MANNEEFLKLLRNINIQNNSSLSTKNKDEQLRRDLEAIKALKPKEVEPQYLEAIKYGASQSLPGLAISALTGYKSNYEPKTPGEKVLSTITEYAPDIASIILSGGASAIGNVGKAVGTEAIKTALPKLGIKAYREALSTALKTGGKEFSLQALKELPKAEIRQIARLATKEAAKKEMPKLIGKQILGGATEGALYGSVEGIKSPLRQYVNEGDVSLDKTLKDTGSAVGFGAGIGGGIGLISGGIRGISALLGEKVRPASTGAKPGLVNKAILDTDKQFTEIKKGFRTINSINKAEDKINVLKNSATENQNINKIAKAIEKLNIKKEEKLIKLSDSIKRSGMTTDEFLQASNIQKAPSKVGLPLDYKEAYSKITNADNNFKAILLRNNLKKVGVDDEIIKTITNKVDKPWLDKMLNINTLIDKIQTQTGDTSLYPAFRKVEETMNQSSHSELKYDKITNDISSFIKSNKLRPEDVGAVVENPNVIASPAHKEAAQMFKKLTDDFYAEAKSINPNIGYIENYLPGKRKIYFTGNVKNKVSIEKDIGKYKASFEQQRLLDQIPELENIAREKDVVKLAGYYNRALQRMKIERAFKDVDAIEKRLQLRGYNKEADYIRKWYETSVGKSNFDYNKISKNVIVNDNSEYLKKLIELGGEEKKSFSRTMLKKINEMMYESWVGTNPNSWIKQYFQPHLVGDAELGARYINKASRSLKKYSKLINDNIKDFTPTKIDLTEMASLQDVPEGVISKILRYPGRKGMQEIFTPLDIRNRKVSFLGAYLKAKETGFSPETLQTLNRAQRTYVKDILTKQGEDKAAIEFGKIMSSRINYIYNIIDKPLALRGGLAEYIPFTTWGRNQWNLFYGDLINKPLSNISIKRILMPMLQLKAVSLLTGIDLKGYSPAASMLGIANVNIAPGVLQPFAELSQGNVKNATKEAMSIIPAYNAILNAKRLAKRAGIK